MKHGMAFGKLSRTSSHRSLMLRNMVTSLFEHEQITTTLPKAREAARLAEKIITLGKRGKPQAVTQAAAFLLDRKLIPKLFGPLAQRYAQRPGGYTRIHKFGNRPGDNAPNAILELVDNPKDLRWAITARSVGWELVKDGLKAKEPIELIQTGVQNAEQVVKRERETSHKEPGVLRPKTKWNLQKVLKYRGEKGPAELVQRATEYADSVLANTVASKVLEEDARLRDPGVMLPGETRGALQLAKGQTIGQSRAPSVEHVLSVKRMFSRKSPVASS